jgi:putative PIN family toxin of toxin-antitoxin system
VRAVLDTSVVVSGIGWRTESHSVLTLLAQRTFVSCRTPLLSDEWLTSVERVAKKTASWKNQNWLNWLIWLKAASKLHDDLPAKRISRDKNDDMIVLAAVAACADYIVTKDPDLLMLNKPYGIACITPRKFLSVVLNS